VDVERIARGLGVARSDIVHHAWCDNGPHWRAVLLRSAEQVLGLRPDPATLGGLSMAWARAAPHARPPTAAL
jgi:predicted PhzF superfamily epimerase YddE/YHI9